MKLEIEGRTRNETVCCVIVECQGNIVNLGSNVRVGQGGFSEVPRKIDRWLDMLG